MNSAGPVTSPSQASGSHFQSSLSRTKTSNERLQAIVKTFVLIGGVDGIQEVDLRRKLLKVGPKETRKQAEKNLHELFLKSNSRGNGALDLKEFQDMIESSRPMADTMREFLKTIDTENEKEDSLGLADMNLLDGAGLVMTIANTVILAISTDFHPTWKGWNTIEACFVCAFSIEIFFRIYRCGKQWQERNPDEMQNGTAFLKNSLVSYFREPLNDLDIAVTLMAWADLIITAQGVDGSSSLGLFTILRMLRLARLGRLLRVIYSCVDLVLILEGIMKGLKLVGWSFVLFDMVAVLWAIILRQMASDPLMDPSGKIGERFPTVPDSMGIVYRCTVLNAGCVDSNGVSIYDLINEHLGLAGSYGWFCTEIFVFLGVLNAVSSVFLVQAMKNDANVRGERGDDIHNRQKDIDNLKELDELLHGLTKAQRQSQQQQNPQAGNVDTVVRYLQEEYPLTVAELPNVTDTVKTYAKSIEEWKEQYQQKVDNYQARESRCFTDLLNVPSAKIYTVGHGQVENLFVDNQAKGSDESVHLGLDVAPLDAVEVALCQRKQAELDELLVEAEIVQQHMKGIIWPESDWANSKVGGRSGNIWNESKQLCDEAVDPGTKKRRRIKQKVQMKYGGRHESNHDYSRLGLMYYSVDHLLQGLAKLLEYSSKGMEGIQVIRIQNHFVAPTNSGWQDVTVLLRVQVPTECVDAEPLCHVMELQMQLKNLVEVQDQAREHHMKIRRTLPEEAVDEILDRLVSDDVPDLEITREEWLLCIGNDKVRFLLNELGVPAQVQKDVVDVVDWDGTGTISEAELREGLLMCGCRGLPQAHDLLSCRLKIREVQQWLRYHIDPQLRVLRDMLKSINTHATSLKNSSTEGVLHDEETHLRSALLEAEGKSDTEVGVNKSAAGKCWAQSKRKATPSTKNGTKEIPEIVQHNGGAHSALSLPAACFGHRSS